MLKQIHHIIFIILLSALLLACGGGGGDSVSPETITPGVTTNPLSIALAENTSAAFTVVLNTEPVSDVTINVSSSDIGGAEVDLPILNFTNSAGEAPWNIPQTVTVSGIEDGIIDGNQDINIVLELGDSIDNVYRELSQTTVAAAVADIDTAGLSVTGRNLFTSEKGLTDTFTVALNTPPDGDVVIDVNSLDTTEGTVSVAFLTFNNSNWSVAQTVTVDPVDDNEIDGNKRYSIVMSINSSGTNDTTGYAVLTSALVSVINADDDNISEGTIATPMVLALGPTLALPHVGLVDNTNSYYEITRAMAGSYYVVNLSDLSENVDLFVYEDASFISLLCNSQLTLTESENCLAKSTGSSLWVRVDGQLTGGLGASYGINVTEVDILIPDFTSNNTPLALLDNDSLTDTLDITGAPVSLTSVEVQVDITHTYDEDLTITLISPAGTQIILSKENGGNGDNYTNTAFSSSARIPIWVGAAPFFELKIQPLKIRATC